LLDTAGGATTGPPETTAAAASLVDSAGPPETTAAAASLLDTAAETTAAAASLLDTAGGATTGPPETTAAAASLVDTAGATTAAAASAASLIESAPHEEQTQQPSGPSGTTANNKCPCISPLAAKIAACATTGDCQAGPTADLINVNLNGVNVTYPAATGTTCGAWDNGNYPGACLSASVTSVAQNPGFGAGWCAQEWCYVDPCNCDLATKPKLSVYVPNALYNNKPVFYSYSTCGGSDGFNTCPGKAQADCSVKCTWVNNPSTGVGSCMDTGSAQIPAMCPNVAQAAAAAAGAAAAAANNGMMGGGGGVMGPDR